MEKVLDYISHHLDGCLSLEQLGKEANFSKFHFHRQFSGWLGISVYQYIQLQRLKRAGYQLAFRKEQSVTQIGLNAGFKNPESFSRAFKSKFLQSPQQFRNQPDWNNWFKQYEYLTEWRELKMGTNGKEAQKTTASKVTIVKFQKTKVAVLEHRGPPRKVFNTVARFIKWRKESGTRPGISETYNILYDDPEHTNPLDYRIDICASITKDVAENPYGVVTRTIPEGDCACIRHIGSDENLRSSFEYLYSEWLPASGRDLRDFPCFLHRVSLFPDIKEHEMLTDIYLPLKP